MSYIMKPYDDAMRQILDTGFAIEGDRTGVGTLCKFGISTEYDISEHVPIMTYRQVNYTSIIKEVLWYISGSHSISELESKGCGIWSPWKNEEFAKRNGLPSGSGGYIYGFNLIHFGAKIRDVESYKQALKVSNESTFDEAHKNDTRIRLDAFYNESGKLGFNQLDYVINTLKDNPKSRQACFTFWRPDTNKQAVLPACHAMYSFIVSPNSAGELKVLNCHVFQRSCDWFIGVGHGNLWTATLFTYMIAQQLGMIPGKIYHSGAHCHLYMNLVDNAKEYLRRVDEEKCFDSPKLVLTPRESIYDYTVDDFKVVGYEAHEKMNVKPAV